MFVPCKPLQPSLVFREEHSSLLQNLEITAVIIQGPEVGIIKLIKVVIYGFRNKLECLALNTRLRWKGLPGTNGLAYYEKL